MSTPIPTNEATFTVAEIAFATGGNVVRGGGGEVVVGVTTDSRAIVAGNLFVALKGETFDGHRFLEVAREKGAAAVIVARGESVPAGIGAVVVVDDTLVALGELARRHRDRWRRSGPERHLIAITGSAGKTTTKELTAAVAASVVGVACVHATCGNLNNRVGVPMTILGLRAEHSVAVVECGTSIRGEIPALAAICAPDVAVLTHVGVAHAEGLMRGDESPREAVAREKSALLSAARVVALACGDDVWASAALPPKLALPMRETFGRGADCSYRLVSVDAGERGSRVRIERLVADGEAGGRRALFAVTLELPLLGDAAALDLAAAVGAVHAIRHFSEVDEAAINAALARHIRPVPGRLFPRHRRDGALVLDDTYNASPSAFADSIATARAIATRSDRRLVIVAGEMRELGSIADASHDEVGRALVDARPAWLVTTGGRADRYAAIASEQQIPVDRCASPAEAVARVAERIQPRDLVLVKGSRGVALEVVVGAILAHGASGGEVIPSLMQSDPDADTARTLDPSPTDSGAR